MKPAFSVIFFTTLAGMGQGVFLATYIAQLIFTLNLEQNPNNVYFYIVCSEISVVLMCAGLIFSFLHLGHPMRAWRAISKWKTSWLSREVIILPICIFLIFIYGIILLFGWDINLFLIGANIHVSITLLIGLIAVFVVFALFIATGMIYACLKFLQEWHSPLTVINYILMGTASGFTLTTVIMAFMLPRWCSLFAIMSLIILFIAFICRMGSLCRNKKLRPKSTIQSAIGIHHSKIQQKSMGFMGGSVNTRDFFHGKTRSFIRSIKYIFIIFAFIIPLVLLAIVSFNSNAILTILSILFLYSGLIAERWYFFAEGNHPQNIYYQTIS